MPKFETPMMIQYLQLKEKHADCILLFRLGDFYEMFLDDAEIGAKTLNIALTSRDRGKDGRVPMAGIPYHAVDSYLPKLVKAGYKVAVCEQVSDPGEAKLVEREVVRIVTPGTLMDGNSLDEKENNFILGIHVGKDAIGIALADISTGYFQAFEHGSGKMSKLVLDEIVKMKPSECVLPPEVYNDPIILGELNAIPGLNIFPYLKWNSHVKNAGQYLRSHFEVSHLDIFGIQDYIHAQKAAAGLLGYLKYTQKEQLTHIKKIIPYSANGFVFLDKATISNLELFSTIREGKKKGSLINHLDQTSTSMGGRKLREWLLKPSYDRVVIEHRYDAVEEFISNKRKRREIIEQLCRVSDIERLISRLSVGIGNPKDLIALRNSLENTARIKGMIEGMGAFSVKEICSNLSIEAVELSKYIQSTIVDDPPYDPKGGGLVREGIVIEIDKLRKIIDNSQKYISDMEERERKRTGIPSLKIKYNQVFGYYIEITKAKLDSVPEDYDRKQTLVNAERFITPELKEHEEIVLSAEEKIKELEYKKFLEIVEYILSFTVELQLIADSIAVLDCLITFAQLSEEKRYCRPEIIDTGEIEIKLGRHPVVEEFLGPLEFIPNDVYLNNGDHQLIVITGPNMSGKSVYIRQTAVLVLMAQVGCFVPAESARISLVDKVFVRSGASDIISSGLSTFMVEMVEAANILNNATSNSLIVMDEIGRGTSTYDGISIAWAIAEHLVKNRDFTPKTLFATHYHELQGLEKEYPEKIRNYQVAVDRNEGEPVFLHKVILGGADSSFGISVAKLAGVPIEVCDRAEDILEGLENGSEQKPEKKQSVRSHRLRGFSDDLTLERLREADVESMSPLDALNFLADLKKG